MSTELALRPWPLDAEIDLLAQAYARANGPVIRLVNRLGGRLEAQMALMPVRLRAELERVSEAALQMAHGLAAVGDAAPATGRHGAVLMAAATGAVGGAGGLATAIAELPVTITVILHAIRREARLAGYDPDAVAIRAACIEVFAAGSPLAADDGVNSAFLAARLSLTGPALQRLIASVAPRLAATMGQKLMLQAVPVLGAVTGAALNAAYLNYYREIARIRFALMRLAEIHGAGPVLAGFATAAARPRIVGR